MAQNTAPQVASSVQATMVTDHVSPSAPIEAKQKDKKAVLPAVMVKGRVDNGLESSDAASGGVISAASLADLPVLRPGLIRKTVKILQDK